MEHATPNLIFGKTPSPSSIPQKPCPSPITPQAALPSESKVAPMAPASAP